MIQIHFYTTCQSDYFGGHHKPVVQVMVDGTTTYEQVKLDLLDYGTIEPLEDLLDDTQWEEYKLAVVKWFNDIAPEDMSKLLWDRTLDVPEDGDDWDVYSYFIIDIEETEDETDI